MIRTEDKIAYVMASTVGWAIAGTIGAAVANSAKRKKSHHPILRGTFITAAVGAVASTVYIAFMTHGDTGVSGQLAGSPSRQLSDPRFP